MKKTLILITSLLLLLVSCKNPVFLPNPNIDNPDKDSITPEVPWHAPTDLKSTQGDRRKITLTWKMVPDADRYFIYRSKTQFGEFIKCGETKNREPIYEITGAESGYDMYYRVSAVDVQNNISEMSNIARGTTLAIPVISSISGVPEKEDNSVSVSWYMNNADAYESTVHYNVICYDQDKKEIQRLSSEGKNTKIIFEDLNPNTNYYFQVEAYNSDNKVEASDILDAATARRLIPDPASNLVVDKGNSKEGIKISFNVPNHVDYSLGKNQFEPVPIYFKIYRREIKDNVEPGQFVLIKDEFGYSTKEVDGKKVIDYSMVDFGNGPKEYEPGENVEYIDKLDVKRDSRYEYKVQSFAYVKTSNPISSDASGINEIGWLLPNLEFSVNPVDYEIVDLTNTDPNTAVMREKKSAKITFNFSMKNFEVPYKYKVVEYKKPLKTSNPDETKNNPPVETVNEIGEGKVIIDAGSVGEINRYVRNFKDLVAESGYYSYELKVYSHENVELETYKAIGQSLITKSMDVPEIGEIVVTSGYSDKIELKWNWIVGYEYKLTYRDFGSDKEIEIPHAKLVENQDEASGVIVYTDTTAVPGVERKYSLTIDSSWFSITSKEMEATVPVPPKLIPQYTYDKVGILIENQNENTTPVYNVSVKFVDETLNSKYELKQIENENKSIYEYEIVKKDLIPDLPSDEIKILDASIYGSEVKFEVEENRKLQITTYNDNKNPTFTEGDVYNLKNNITTASIGQALLKTTATQGSDSNNITISWNKVQGANKYLVFRDRFHLGKTSLPKDLIKVSQTSDKYIVTIDEKENITVSLEEDVTLSADEKLDNYISVSYNNETKQITLKDTYRPIKTTEEKLSSWLTGQSQITWGAPYQYMVIPILDSEDPTNPFKDNNNDIIFTDNYKIHNAKSVLGGTRGYGWNVAGSKGSYSENLVADNYIDNVLVNNAIQITWTKSFFDNNNEYLIFRRGKGENDWTRRGTSNVTEFTDNVGIIPGNIYEYAVIVKPTELLKPDSEFVNRNTEDRTQSYGFTLPNAAIKSVSKGNEGVGIEKVKFQAVSIAGKDNNLIGGYQLQVRNNNIDSHWHNIKTIPITDENKDEFEFEVILNSEECNGLLKVLRDNRHYFRVRVYAEDNAKQRYYSRTDDDYKYDIDTDYVKWGTRDISDLEFARAAIIGMSTGMEKERPASIKSGYNGNGINGLKSTSESVVPLFNYNIKFVYSNYIAKHETQGDKSNQAHCVTINGTMYGGGASLEFHQTHYWTPSPIKVAYNGKEGTIEFVGNQDNKDVVGRELGTIKVIYNNNIATEFNLKPMSGNTKTDIKPLPFIFYGSSYLNNSEDWK